MPYLPSCLQRHEGYALRDLGQGLGTSSWVPSDSSLHVAQSKSAGVAWFVCVLGREPASLAGELRTKPVTTGRGYGG